MQSHTDTHWSISPIQCRVPTISIAIRAYPSLPPCLPVESTRCGPLGWTSQPHLAVVCCSPHTHSPLHRGEKSVWTPFAAPTAKVESCDAKSVSAADTHSVRGAQDTSAQHSCFSHLGCPPVAHSHRYGQIRTCTRMHKYIYTSRQMSAAIATRS